MESKAQGNDAWKYINDLCRSVINCNGLQTFSCRNFTQKCKSRPWKSLSLFIMIVSWHRRCRSLHKKSDIGLRQLTIIVNDRSSTYAAIASNKRCNITVFQLLYRVLRFTAVQLWPGLLPYSKINKVTCGKPCDLQVFIICIGFVDF